MRTIALPVALAWLSVAGIPQATAAPDLVVSREWLASHLSDPAVVVIATGQVASFNAKHIAGARFLAHEDTMDATHRLLEPAELSKALAKAGGRDDARIVLYGNDAMTTGWVYMAFAAIGHGDHVSILDGNIEAWQRDGRPTSSEVRANASTRITVKPAPDVIVDRKWVSEKLKSPEVHLLDVRSVSERDRGFIPGSTLVLWQELFQDLSLLTFKSKTEIRALLTRAGLTPGQQAVTYCAVGMRASLMYFAARYAGVPARVYVGSWQDWSRGVY